MKTKEITLPIDPNKTYVGKNGTKTIDIKSDGSSMPHLITYEDGAELWAYADGHQDDLPEYSLIAELILEYQPKCDQDIDNQQTTYWKKMKEFMKQNQKTNPVIRKEQPKERDWSGVVKKLMHYAHRHCNSFRYHDSNGLYDLAEFKEDALAILQDFDRMSQPATQAQPSIQKKNDENVTIGHTGAPTLLSDKLRGDVTTCNTPVPTEWSVSLPPFIVIVGALCEYKVNDERITDWRNGEVIALNDKAIVILRENGHYKVLQRNCTMLRPYTPSPAEHIYTTEEIKEELKYGVCADLYHKDEPTAVRIYKRAEIICQLLKELGRGV